MLVSEKQLFKRGLELGRGYTGDKQADELRYEGLIRENRRTGLLARIVVIYLLLI